MLRPVILLLSIYISISNSQQFANELFKYDNLDLYPKRTVESIIVPKHIDDVAYISLSAEQGAPLADGRESTSEERMASNPLIAKIVLEGLTEVLWTTHLNKETANMRHTSLSLSVDGKKLFVAATLINAKDTEHKFRVEVINAEDGAPERSFYASNMPGSQIIHATTVNKTGLYFCGRSTSNKIENDTQLESVATWDLLLGKISFSGNLDWRYTTNVGNKTCMDIHQHEGNIYTTGYMYSNGKMLSVVYKHSSDGSFLWGRRVRSTLQLPMKATKILANGDGVFLGSFLSDPSGCKSFLQKLSTKGTLLWSRKIGDGQPVSLGYWEGYVYGLVSGPDADDSMTLTRLDKFANSSHVTTLAINGTGAHGAWVPESQAFFVVSHTESRKVIYGVGTLAGRGVSDAVVRKEYEIWVTMSVDKVNRAAVKDYLADVSHGGNVRSSERDGYTIMTIHVREASDEVFRETYERVTSSLTRSDDGRSPLERDLGIVVDVRDIGFRKSVLKGRRVRVGIVIAVVVAVAFVGVAVGVWFCASNWFSLAGEQVAMV